MTLTTKNSSELNGPDKPGGSSQNAQGKAGQSPRSNPVCLEVSVTIRSLPTEVGGPTQPFREECRTVIVFENGAVLRTTSNLSVGQSVILSNSQGRDVVCRVAGGRNLPNVKGYVEVEFIEAVDNFWGLHQGTAPVAAAVPPAVLPSSREATPPSPPPPVPIMTPRATTPAEPPAKPVGMSSASGPSIENIAGRAGMSSSAATRDSKADTTRPGLEKMSKSASEYSSSETAAHTSLANWDPPASDAPAEKLAIPTKREAASIASAAPVPARDFLSKGLMAYEQPRSSSGASSGRVPLIVGVGALVLAGVCGVVFYIHRGSPPFSIAKNAAVSQRSTPQPAATSTAPEPVPAPPAETAPEAAQTQMQAQPVATDPAQQAAAAAPVPAVATSPATSDSPTESRPEARFNARPDTQAVTRNAPRPEKKAVAAKQPEPPSSRRPLIPNLKIGSPSAPSKTPANQGEGSAPITEIASAGTSGAVTPAGLLTSNGRTSNPPAPPPAAFATAASAPAASTVAPVAAVSAAGVVRDPKLISMVRPAYPATARESNIQGSVTVVASVDANGKVVSAKALSGPMLLRQAAEDSVKQWKYSPGLIDGKAAPSQVTVSVDFRLK